MLGGQPRSARSWLACLALVTMLGGLPARADSGSSLDEPIDARVDSYWELGSGMNLGLVHAVVSHDRFWGELSTVVGVPLWTSGDPAGAEWSGVLAVGYGLPFAENAKSRWYFDLFVESVVGQLNGGTGSAFVGGAGFGFGFRYLLFSGWSLGMRMPSFGMASIPGSRGTGLGQYVASFYLANVFAWSVLTVGYRF